LGVGVLGCWGVGVFGKRLKQPSAAGNQAVRRN